MCGIAGIISKGNKSTVEQLLKMIKNLEYRGYDSCGFAFIEKNRLIIAKSAGSIDQFLSNNKHILAINSRIGIAHTRWATHGNVNDINAHPHTDCTGNIAVVHNGIIDNYLKLREELSRTHKFKSTTDTEVIPHLLEEFYLKTNSFLMALKETVRKITGTYALVILTTYAPDKIFFAKNGQPLIIGLDEENVYLASDIPAFLEWTNRVIVLRDGDIGYVSSSQIHIENFIHPSLPQPAIEIVPWSSQQAVLGEFPHYMIKEIFEQPDAINRTILSVPNQLEKTDVLDIMFSANNIYFVAAGSSYYASLYGAYLLNKYGIRAHAIIASEFEQTVGKFIDKDDVLVAISQSGETFDTIQAIKIGKNRGAKIIGIVNNMASTIKRMSDRSIIMGAGPEIGVAATKTFSTQITTINLILQQYFSLQNIDYPPNKKIHELPAKIQEILKSNIPKKMDELSNILKEKSSAFYLGRGLSVPIALEGALKLKEIAYIHAEAYPAGESKHGPIALIEKGFPVFGIVINDSTYSDMISNIQEVKTRGAFSIIIGPKNNGELSKLADVYIGVPTIHPDLDPVLYVIPLQLVSYYTAVTKGLNPDRPRNLAKSVTVA